MNRIYNWQKEPDDPRDHIVTRHLFMSNAFPDVFELQPLIPVYDQGYIGSCVANSVSSCYRYEVAQLLGNFNFDPSRLFVYYNARLIDGNQNWDAGTWIRSGFKTMAKDGLAPEVDWPYDTSKVTTKPVQVAYTNGKKNIIVEYAKVPQSIDTIKQVLMSGAAISFGFNVYESFEQGNWWYTTGIMPVPKSDENILGGHAVTIIGWDNQKQAFLIQNSWGKDWGLKGKFYMPYTFLVSKECDDFWCINKIQISSDENPVDNTKEIILSVFKTKKDISKNYESVIVNIGKILGLKVDINKTKKENIDIVCNYLNIK